MVPTVSVIAATYNRAELLDRALNCYSRQTLPFEQWEYVLVDDHSTDNTVAIVDKWRSRGVPIRLYSAAELGHPKEPGQWRDGCVLRNSASVMARGTVFVFTHPEIMVPSTALELAAAAIEKQPADWHTAVPFWLPAGDYDSVNWRADLANLHALPGFWASDWESNPHLPHTIDYRNQHQAARDGSTPDLGWESEVWWAMHAHRWRWLGGFRNFTKWGSVDVDFLARRRAAGIRTRFIKDDGGKTLMVYHQDHASPRDASAWEQELRDNPVAYNSVDAVRQSGGLASVYYHGPRERAATPKSLDGIFADHIARYQWAAKYIEAGNKVLDVPCGTGYGAKVLLNTAMAHSYTGIDNDGESIEFAYVNYAGINASFYQRDMIGVGTLLGGYDVVMCFEGLEHIATQDVLLGKFYACLNTGGKLLLSTPQKGATPGTFWDQHMVTADELANLLKQAGFVNFKWFYQDHYGTGPDGNPVKAGPVPKDAEIMLVEASK